MLSTAYYISFYFSVYKNMETILTTIHDIKDDVCDLYHRNFL